MSRRLAAVLAALLLAGLLAGQRAVPAVADPSAATLTVSPNPVAAYSTAPEEFVGCGYDPGGVTVVVSGPEAVSWFGGPVDPEGCVDIVWGGFVAGPGVYVVGAYQEQVTGQTVHQRLRAETVLSVV